MAELAPIRLAIDTAARRGYLGRVTHDLDAIPWASLHHAGGTADDVPDMIRALRDPDVRSEAVDALLDSVFEHDEEARRCAVFDCTAHVVPFVAEFVQLDSGDDAGLEDDQAILSDALVDLAASTSEQAEAAAPPTERPYHAATRAALRAHAAWVYDAP